jgi:hypothetical protein
MFDDLAAYYQEHVLSSFNTYRETAKNQVYGRSRDLKMAIEASSALFHLREHLADPPPSRRDIEASSIDYGLLGDIVNAAKHKNITAKTPHGAPLVNNAKCLYEQLISIEYEDSEGKFRHIEKTVMVKLTDGTERNLLEIMTNVVNFWESYMVTIGVKSSAHQFVFNNPLRFRGREECKERLDLEMTKGLRFKQAIKVMRYNNETDVAELVDLTGSKAQLRIRRPKYDVDLFLTNKLTGEEVKTTISLSEEESEKFLKLKNERKKSEYIYALPKAQYALGEMASRDKNSK